MPAHEEARSPRRHWIGEDDDISEVVVEAAATVADTDPDSLPPLGERVDTDSLDGLFAAREPSVTPGLIFTRSLDEWTGLRITFRYAGYEVTVTESYVVLE